MAFVNPDSLFEGEDVSNEKFVNSYKFRPRKKNHPQVSRSTKFYPNQNDSHTKVREEQLQDNTIIQKQRDIEQSMLDSSERSLALLRDSETKGIKIAQEIVHQGEQLQNINQCLDSINTNLNESKKHLNGMTSILYGLKKYISRKMDKAFRRSNSSPNEIVKPKCKHLSVMIGNTSLDHNKKMYHSSPTIHLRNIDAPKSAPVINSQKVNELLDANLNKMDYQVTRLKDLGLAIGEEIEQQSDLIDTVQDKAEVANIKLSIQNRKMDKILGK